MKKTLFILAVLLTPLFANAQEEVADSVALEEIDSVALMEFLQKQIVTEICGIPFGTSYEDAQEMLENKYGLPEYNYQHSKEIITYKHKKYAGITFDSIHFLFQSDGRSTYMNGCVFIIDADTPEQAKRSRDMLYDKLAEKYFMAEGTDDNGFKYYVGGLSPLRDGNIAFTINVLKYNKDLAKLYNPYAARLMYGTYEFITEEF